jgi:hypothetical protein
VTKRVLIPVFCATLLTAAVVAASYGLMAALPQPTAADRFAVRLLDYLEQTQGRGSRIWINGHRIDARCTALSKTRSLITLSDGAKFAIRRSRIRLWHEGTTKPRRPDSNLARAAIADLSGSNSLLAAELGPPLLAGDDMVEPIRESDRTYRIVLSRKPFVSLDVDRVSLHPISARFRSARISARALLLPPARSRHGVRSC